MNYNTVAATREDGSERRDAQDADAPGETVLTRADGAGPTRRRLATTRRRPRLPPPELTEATPEERLAALTAERDEIKDRMLRIAAEFENWKKRARKEQTDAVTEARERVLKDMLEVVDNLERAVGMQAAGQRRRRRGAPCSRASTWCCACSSRSWNATR